MSRGSSEALAERAAFVVTAELPTDRRGGLDAVRAQLEPIAPLRRRDQRDRQHRRARPRLAARDRDRDPAAAASSRCCSSSAATRTGSRSQADIVGAALHGIENVCCLTGDDVTAGDEPEARRVFDLDGAAAARDGARRSRRGRYLSGRPLDPPPHLFLGAVENPGAPPVRLPRRARAEEGRGRRALPAAADLLRPERLEAFVRRGRPRPA